MIEIGGKFPESCLNIVTKYGIIVAVAVMPPQSKERPIMNLLQKSLATTAMLASVAMFAPQASAVVFNPFDAAGSTADVSSVTPGYINSWWVEDGTTDVSPTGGESPANIREFVEQSEILNTTVTDDGCREGLGGLDGTNSKCSGNVFAVKVNDLGYLVFLYASAIGIDDFSIVMNPPNSNFLSRMDVFTTTPSPVPVPGAFLLMLSGLAGFGALSRKKK
jgi:hypothetical protein